MSNTDETNYGPLAGLIGVWEGGEGTDIAPEPDGEENNPYFETISYSGIGNVTNGEEQVLAAVYYRQIVRRQVDGEIFHDQTGYWMWDEQAAKVMHSLSIPRAVSVIAGGDYPNEALAANEISLSVSAAVDDPDWGIIQSPFMRDKAKTTHFSHRTTIAGDQLAYEQTTTVDIYGKVFAHTDANKLTRKA